VLVAGEPNGRQLAVHRLIQGSQGRAPVFSPPVVHSVTSIHNYEVIAPEEDTISCSRFSLPHAWTPPLLTRKPIGADTIFHWRRRQGVCSPGSSFFSLFFLRFPVFLFLGAWRGTSMSAGDWCLFGFGLAFVLAESQLNNNRAAPRAPENVFFGKSEHGRLNFFNDMARCNASSSTACEEPTTTRPLTIDTWERGLILAPLVDAPAPPGPWSVRTSNPFLSESSGNNEHRKASLTEIHIDSIEADSTSGCSACRRKAVHEKGRAAQH
jgi:hypothetical protein